MEFYCGATGLTDVLSCEGLKQDVCPTQDVEGAGSNVNLTAFNIDRDNEYAGCYSPCALLTYTNWHNPFAKYNPVQSPADKYCCAGDYQMPDQCHTGPDDTMVYT
jgi:hypothetical protein